MIGLPDNAGSVAMGVLQSAGVCVNGSAGGPLLGYDIKTQDAMSILKLSLLEVTSDHLVEVYGGPDGCANFVQVGQRQRSLGGVCLYKSKIGQYQSKVDYVVVTGKNPLPTRYHRGSVNVMGAGFLRWFPMDGPGLCQATTTSFGQEAWAVFQRDLNDEYTKDLLKALVNRSRWEQLVGYKITFADVPQHCSIGVSNTTPNIASISPGATNVPLSAEYGDGGVVDVSNVNIFAAPVLDIVKGSDLLSGDLGNDIRANHPDAEADNGGFTENDYYILLDHQCGLKALARGEDWFLLGSNASDSGQVIVRHFPGPIDTAVALGLRSPENTLFSYQHIYRRRDKDISNITELFTRARNNNGDPLDVSGYATSNGPHGLFITGFSGNTLGMEYWSMHLAYSQALPSIAVKSERSDAPQIAQRLVEGGGVVYTAIIVQDKPAPIGLNGHTVSIPAPPDEEGQAYDVDSEVDNLTGRVIEISAPFTSRPEGLSGNLYNLINSDSGEYFSQVNAGGGYTILPGDGFAGSEGAVQTIEFKYNVGDSQTTSVTLGPKYYPVGSFGDSQYVRRSETITRTSTVVAGSNSSGRFVVFVPGLGRYEAINGILEPIYPGDKVEVRITNVPVEK